MGFFSFYTQDTNRSICNAYSGRDTFTVVMSDNKGNTWTEENYEGYGVFGGKDFYKLLAEMNGLLTRSQGIDLWFGDDPVLCPNLNESPDMSWKPHPPNTCPHQGYFYDD